MARITNIKLRRSATSGAVPTTSNLDLGEIALNTYDGKAYMKKDVGGTTSVVEIGSSAAAAADILKEYLACWKIILKKLQLKYLKNIKRDGM